MNKTHSKMYLQLKLPYESLDPATKRRVWMCFFFAGVWVGSPVPTGDLRLPWFLGWWFSSHDFEAIKALLLRRAILWKGGGWEGTWLPITTKALAAGTPLKSRQEMIWHMNDLLSCTFCRCYNYVRSFFEAITLCYVWIVFCTCYVIFRDGFIHWFILATLL